jgi:hypothetical protein
MAAARGLARLAAVHVHAVLRAVDAHLGLGVELLDGAGDGALAVAAGHALDFKLVLHVVLRVKWLMGAMVNLNTVARSTPALPDGLAAAMVDADSRLTLP